MPFIIRFTIGKRINREKSQWRRPLKTYYEKHCLTIGYMNKWLTGINVIPILFSLQWSFEMRRHVNDARARERESNVLHRYRWRINGVPIVRSFASPPRRQWGERARVEQVTHRRTIVSPTAIDTIPGEISRGAIVAFRQSETYACLLRARPTRWKPPGSLRKRELAQWRGRMIMARAGENAGKISAANGERLVVRWVVGCIFDVYLSRSTRTLKYYNCENTISLQLLITRENGNNFIQMFNYLLDTNFKKWSWNDWEVADSDLIIFNNLIIVFLGRILSEYSRVIK